MGDKDQPLQVELRGQTISIEIGVSALVDLLASAFAAEKPRAAKVVVADPYNLACQMVVVLRGKPGGEPGIALSMLAVAAGQTEAFSIDRG